MASRIITAVLSSVFIVSLLNYFSGSLTLKNFIVSIISASIVAVIIFFIARKVESTKKTK
ncbi:hypothetical protein [Kurthia sibirica]|uniref:Uncharacterized protein n=1 Tax=Kurthia sibirica TaxID=202750 RepID=A0A2U3AR30_9BACL|nr:hypothetical protein [Kurthia sibirica]PWI26969.1 hypothetical protein DEX24_01330 [Kurthia sibirica]GEK32482.1 hypothetical protein KSI01_00150 [Kurthia sibirica]